VGKCCCTNEINALKSEILGVKNQRVAIDTVSDRVRDLSKLVADLNVSVQKIDADRLQQKQIDAIVNGLIGIRSLILEDRNRRIATSLERDIFKVVVDIRRITATQDGQRDIIRALAWLNRDILRWLQLLYQNLYRRLLEVGASIVAGVVGGLALQFLAVTKAIAAQGLLILRAIAAMEMALKAYVTLQHGITQRILLAALARLSALIGRIPTRNQCNYKENSKNTQCRFQKQEVKTEKVNVITQEVKVVQQQVKVETKEVRVTQQQVKVETKEVDLKPLERKIEDLKRAMPTIESTKLIFPQMGFDCGLDVEYDVETIKIGNKYLKQPFDLQNEILKRLYRGQHCAPSKTDFDTIEYGEVVEKSRSFEFFPDKPVGVLVFYDEIPVGRQARLNMNEPLNYPNSGWFSWVYTWGTGVEVRLEYRSNFLVPPPGEKPRGFYVSVYPGYRARVKAFVSRLDLSEPEREVRQRYYPQEWLNP
jgi:hypothetical protein